MCARFRNLQYTPRTHLATFFPGSLILPQNGALEEVSCRLGLVTCHFDNWGHQGRALGNQAICWVELCWIQIIALRPPLLVILILRGEISNSFYSNVYLKVKQVCLEAIFRGREVAAVLPIRYMKKSVMSQLWTSSSTISSRSNCCCFFFECTRSNWYRKHKERHIHVAFLKVPMK